VLIISLAFLLSIDDRGTYISGFDDEQLAKETVGPHPAAIDVELNPAGAIRVLSLPLDRFTTIPLEKTRIEYREQKEIEYYQPVKDEIKSVQKLNYVQHEGSEAPVIPGNAYTYPTFHKFNLSEEKYLSIIFDNDIFSNTDYYYTSGQAIELYHPGLRVLPTSILLPSAGKGSVDLYSLGLRQTLYTPIDPDKTDIQHGDRPFSSYLVLGHSRFSNNASRHLRVTSRLDLGVIGPAALGGYVQKSMHEIEPVGWQNQISNDLAANYMIEIEKGLSLNSSIELLGRARGDLGTIHTNVSTGASMRISNAAGYFDACFLRPAEGAGRYRVSYYVMLSADLTGVIYDATLQGGLFSRERSIYTIAHGDISRAVFRSRLSAGVSFRWFHLEAEQVFLTKEFSTGRKHMWSRIKASFRIG
jgi:hypothetical protein